jgi:hypothetical protein
MFYECSCILLLSILSVLPMAPCTVTATLLACYASRQTGMFPVQYSYTFLAAHAAKVTSLNFPPSDKVS